MTHPSIKEALKESSKVARLRSGEDMIPPPNYDLALCLYERDDDGSDVDTPFLSFSRPQDFATNPHMKYQRLGVLSQHEKDGKVYMTQSLVHLYWDGSRDADSARQLILDGFQPMYGVWEPTAPSDPLKLDDFWDHDELGEPPNGYWEHFDPDEGEMDNGFRPFDNFEREPYERVDLSHPNGKVWS